MINCILAGVGGQGTVLASKLIAQCAMNRGQYARTAETIGMAQRGGCVVSHVRIGERSDSPMIPLHSADIIIGFEPSEAVRCLPYLKKGGVLVVSDKAIQPVTASLSGASYRGEEMLRYLQGLGIRLIVLDTETVCQQCGSSKVLNVALLGAAVASGVLGFSLEDVEKALPQRVKGRFIAMNTKALYAGAQTAKGV